MPRSIKSSIRRIIDNLPTKAKYKFIIRDWTRLSDLEACAKVLETKRFSRNLRPTELNGPIAKEIIVLAPHPDDEMLGAGGTLLNAIDKNANITIVYLTNGSNDKKRAEKIVEETLNVCEKARFKSIFLDFQVGSIPLKSELINDLFAKLLTKRGSNYALFLPFFLDDHDDHRRVSDLIHHVKLLQEFSGSIEIWAYQVYSTVIPNVVVDVSQKIEEKISLIKLWRNVSGSRDWAHYILGLNATNCRYIQRPGAIYAEGFFVIPLNEYLKLSSIYFEQAGEGAYYSRTYSS